HRPLYAAFAANEAPDKMAQQQGRLRARRTLRKRKQCRNAGVKNVVFRDRHHEAISSRWCTFLVITEALVVSGPNGARRRVFCIDRDSFAEPNELILLTARRTLEKPLVTVVEETGDAQEPVRGGDAAQKIPNDFFVFHILEQRMLAKCSDGAQSRKDPGFDRQDLLQIIDVPRRDRQHSSVAG